MKRFTLTCALAAAGAAAASAQAATFRIEIDYMVGTHSHQPSQLVIDAVVQMFACKGHTLIIDVDDAIPHHSTLVRDPDNCNNFFGYSGAANSFGALKATWFNHSHDDGWHYCIFAHNYQDSDCSLTSSSGLGQLSGWNFIVSLGSFSGGTGTPFDQASTLAHEFGHNLGLSHCGSLNCSDDTLATWVGPYMPNMPSTMSYRYQLAGVKSNMVWNNLCPDEALFKNIDYSAGTLCGLNEDSLNEVFGTVMRSVDWNCSGTFTSGVAQDVNGGNSGWCSSNGNRTTLSDYNEWGNISDPLPSLTGEEPQDISCITAEEWEIVQKEMAFGGGTQPALAVEGCIGGRNIFIGPFFFAEAGTCVLPYDSVIQAHTAAPNNSVFFFKPGTYNEAGVVTLSKPGVYMSEVGTSEVR
jgi:hypothetical protein